MTPPAPPSPPHPVPAPAPAFWRIVALAAAILMVAFGIRLTVGLFVHPIMMDKGFSIAAVSMALAIGQIGWGLFQPIFGAWADRGHGFAALLAGALCTVVGLALTIACTDILTFTLAQGILVPAGAAAGSFAILIGIAGRHIPADRRSVAGGFINSGGSLGQFVFAPIAQFFIQMWGYAASLLALSGFALAALVPAWLLCGRGRMATAQQPEQEATALTRSRLADQLRVALRDRSYLCLSAGFFTCGFHVAFLVTHLPGEVSACGHGAPVAAASIAIIGLCNIAGSIGAGYLGKYCRMKLVLAGTYAARAVMITCFMLSAKSVTAFYVFSAATGFTWLATVPPTAGLVGKLFGQRYVGTLFGLAFFAHQIGGFFGAWLGGLAMSISGSLFWVWWIDIALAALAALVNLPIREAKPARTA